MQWNFYNSIANNEIKRKISIYHNFKNILKNQGVNPKIKYKVNGEMKRYKMLLLQY
jgi:hypothetical protein